MNGSVRKAVLAVALLILSAAAPVRATATTDSAQGAADVEPTVSSLAPLSVAAGGPAFKLTLKGAGFASGATAYWNNAALPTKVVSSTELTAFVSAALGKKEGYASITVRQGDTVTSRVGLAVHPPAPALRSVQPASARTGAGVVPITVTGANFTAKAVLICNGLALKTSFVSSDELHATLSPAETATTGFLHLQVRQAGVTSKGLAFVVGTPQSAPRAAKRSK